MDREQIQKSSEHQNKSTKHISKQLRLLRESNTAWQAELIESLHQNRWRPGNLVDVQSFGNHLSRGVLSDRENMYQLIICHYLRFQEIEERQHTISEAYKKTFEWVFHDPEHGLPSIAETLSSGNRPTIHWDNFSEWLRGSNNLYWITGKPGSGKSTLMKFLYYDHRTMALAKQWSEPYDLVTAGFFFWNSGTNMQMSFKGLLQTLLHQCTKGHPEIIPQIFPDRWHNHIMYGGDLRAWTTPELVTALKDLMSIKRFRFLIFMDGLDEYDKEPAEIATFILELRQLATDNVKFCVSSRPWLVFEEAFKNVASLRVEDLTRPDIQFYVEAKLASNDQWRDLQKLLPEDTRDLMTELVEKASGVFLWIVLVVESILGGLRDGDSIEDLWRRLNQLPTSLEELFDKILRQLNPEYFMQACELFQLVQASAEDPLTLLHLSFHQDGYNAALKAQVEPIPHNQLVFRAETMRRRLLSRCKGLLEAPELVAHGHRAKVTYLHRTVRDFFRSPRVWGYVQDETPDFHVTASLCASYLRAMKSTPSGNLQSFWTLLNKCIKYARRWDQSKPESQIEYLDELKMVGEAYWNLNPSEGSPYSSSLEESIATADPGNGRWRYIMNRQQGATANLAPPDLENALTNYAGPSKKAAKLITANLSTAPNLLAIPHWTNTVYLTVQPLNPPVFLRSFFDYLFMLKFGSYITAKLNKELATHYKLDGQSLVARSLVDQDFEMVRELIKHGADPNTKQTQHETGWEFLLECIRDCPDSPVERKETLYTLVELFLDHGADPSVTVINKDSGVVILPLKKALMLYFECLGPERTAGLIQKVKTAKKRQKKPSRLRRSLRAIVGS